MSAVARSNVYLSRSFDGRAIVICAFSAATITLGAVAVYSPKYALGAVAVAALIGLAFWRLPLGIAAFTVLTFPEHLPGALGAGATVAKPLGAILAFVWIATVVAHPRSNSLLSRDLPVAFWVIVAFVVLAATSALWAPDQAQLRYQLGRLVQAAVFLLVVYTAASTRKGFRTIIWAFLVGSVVTAAYSIATGSYDSGRLSGIFDPNYFAAELIPAILVSFFIFISHSGRTRAVAGSVLVFDIVAFSLTQSRGGIAGLAVGLVAAVAFAGRARPRAIAGVLVVLAAGMGYYFAFAPYHVQSTFSSSLAGASSGRADEWRIALRMFENHPVDGVGLGNFIAVEPSYSTQTVNLNFVNLVVTRPLVAHNSYLEVAAELGLGGLALFVSILGIVTHRARRVLSSLGALLDGTEFYARGLVAGAIGMFAAYFFLSGQYEKQLWLVLGLLASVSALGRKLASADTQPSAG